ncbi:MAG TPA: hypothetical protein VFW78_02595 [Bacteroidia bacterium]|nr:hypothetical protein [Bacteroidia bacterium]
MKGINHKLGILTLSAFLGAICSVSARENPGAAGNTHRATIEQAQKTASACLPTTAETDLDINNIRTTIQVAGDMWWDLVSAKYEVPVGTGKHSIFAGSLWIGGIDAGGNIKVAGQTYRQTGVDFWGGPIDQATVNITPDRCQEFDRHWKVSKIEVQNFIADPSKATKAIKEWPGTRDSYGSPGANEEKFLAPFVDVNADGEYDYQVGDYPGYNFSGDFPSVPGTPKTLCNDYLFGDQTIWWVFNDVGNVHTESNSDPIGLEIRAQAFAFKTNDEINNMTFYKYQIINRSALTLTNTYFGQWVDPDLGKYDDDYVGCDVEKGLGYCYNGDADDDGATGYGLNPPAVGVDFFQGPIADVGDGIDNDRDGCVDCTYLDSSGVTLNIPDNVLGEQIIMSKFVYYENTNNAPNGNPNGLNDFYNYLRGIWLDNEPMSYGGTGRQGSAGNTGALCNFMFPDNTDVDFQPPAYQPWTEASSGNTPSDRRFLQSAGAFTLQPGAVNYITTGVVWGRATQGGPLASVNVIQQADAKAQALFDNCFKLIDGPDAPDIAIRELDRKMIFALLNTDTASIELYDQLDPTIIGYDDSVSRFRFQGYQIYQFKDASVTTADIGNPDKVRLLYQCDVKDGVKQLVNFNYDANLNANIPVEMVNGADNGISHTIVVTQDLFASGDPKLVNNKTYYYTIVSYAYNQYKKYDPNDPLSLDGQKKPYLAGRNNIKTYSAIPHIPSPENSGQAFGSEYGSGPRIKRLEGQGNGGKVLDFVSNYENELLNPPYRIYQPEYTNGHGPINVKVYDPVKIKDYSYDVRFDGINPTSNWSIYNMTTNEYIPSERPISVLNEQILPEWGLTSTIYTVIEAGKPGAVNNAFLEASQTYTPSGVEWLDPIRDTEDEGVEDWIRSGVGDVNAGLDDGQFYETMINGTWAPYKLTSKNYPGPKWSGIAEAQIALSPGGNSKTAIASVDIVITADKSKWSRCVVIETGPAATVGGAKQFELRKQASVGKDGQPDGTGDGMGWFPGYAVNLETGERLNIAFGENSAFGDQNSQDMKWNPTTTRTVPSIDPTLPDEPVFGGMHYIYVFGHNGDDYASGKPKDVPMYDECAALATLLSSGNTTDKRNAWKDCMYTSIPVLSEQYSNLNLPDQIPSELRIRLRVARTYRTYATSAVLNNTQALTVGTTYYVASTPVTHDGTTYSNVGDSFQAMNTTFTGAGTVTETAPQNGFNPWYSFGTGDIANSTNNVEAAKTALDYINVVPNPYYSYSGYETSQLDTRVKITNLPPKCEITIFTMSGTVVRKFKRDAKKDNSEGIAIQPGVANESTSIDWDLKNYKGIPIASGMYLIHVKADGIGERTLKWFGVLRPIDLDSF